MTTTIERIHSSHIVELGKLHTWSVKDAGEDSPDLPVSRHGEALAIKEEREEESSWYFSSSASESPNKQPSIGAEALPLRKPIPQKIKIPIGHLKILMNGIGSTTPCETSSPACEKLERFLKECFHQETGSKSPYAERKGIWNYEEVRQECLKVFEKYHPHLFRSSLLHEFFTNYLAGFTRTLTELSKRYHRNEYYFKTEFPKALKYSDTSPSIQRLFLMITKHLESDRANIKKVIKEYDRIIMALIKVQKDRRDPQCLRLVFPSFLDSGALVLDKKYHDDCLALEKFYFDYLDMLHLNDLYLHCFIQSIQKASAILKEGF